MNIYTSKSNAMRAAKKKGWGDNAVGVTTEGTWFVMDPAEVEGYTVGAEEEASHGTPTDTFDPTEAAADEAPMGRNPGSYTAEELAVMGEYGAGAPVEGSDYLGAACPHCGINHKDNGYTFDGDVVNGVRLNLSNGTWVCLGCNGEWGALPKNFDTMFAAFKAAGNSKCKSLRLVAYEYHGNRKNFIADAMANGVKETTAAANWACMRRGEL